VTEQTYHVIGMSCAHCAAALTEEVSSVPGVESVQVDVETGRVVVGGTAVDDGAVRAAVDEAGYAVA